MAGNAIEQMLNETGIFKVVSRATPIPPDHEACRTLHVIDPDLILLDLSEWDEVSKLVQRLQKESARAPIIGFREQWNLLEQLNFKEAGVSELLRDPFSLAELESAAYKVLHQQHPVTNSNILAFLPAKAGSGASTVALNTAGALAKRLRKRVLLLEGDHRSGVLSILLNKVNRHGASEALQHAGELTPVEWQQQYVEFAGMHVLLSNPSRHVPRLSWAEYYQLLLFVDKLYDMLLMDLPEVINQGTAEIGKSARGVFVVCTPELPSLQMARQRCAELEDCGIPESSVHIVLNRWDRRGLSVQEIEKTLKRPVFVALPNDYAHIARATTEAALVSADSAFGQSCHAFARKISGIPEAPREASRFALLKRLARVGLGETSAIPAAS